MGWHQTYRIKHHGSWCLSSFQAKPRYKTPHFHLHTGELRPMFENVIKTDVIVFPASLSPSQSAFQRVKKLTAEMRYVHKMIDQMPDLKGHLSVVKTWTQTVDSVEYLPGQRKTVEKEDTVVMYEHVTGDLEVEYDGDIDGGAVCGESITQLRMEHPMLADLVESSRRYSGGRKVISCLRAVCKAGGVYHLTFVSFHPCCTEVIDRSSGLAFHSQSLSPEEASLDDPDGSVLPTPLVPTAPEVLEPSAPEPEVLEQPSAPEPEAIAPEMHHRLEPTAPTEEESVSVEVGPGEEKDSPPSYWECVGTGIAGIRKPPPYQRCQDPPPPYHIAELSGTWPPPAI
ncbi:hypothetical protein ACOMHN_047449 [Nucella lapillus]